MGKKSKRKFRNFSTVSKKILPRQREKTAQTNKLWRKLRFKAYIPVLLTLIGIGGTLGTFYGLRPQPVIISYVSLNDENPFESQFSIMNNGSIDMQNVRFVCFVKSIYFRGGTISSAYSPIAKFPQISAGDTVTLPSLRAKIPTSIITAADVAIIVKYRTSFCPWHTERILRLVALKGNPKGFRWVQQPVDDAFIKELKSIEVLHRKTIEEGGWN